MPRTRETDPYVMAMQNAAYHLTEVMTAGAPTVIRCGIGKNFYRITIEPGILVDSAHPVHKDAGGKTVNVWDQVWIALEGDAPDDKGNWCGNRCGGRDVLAGLYAGDLKVILRNQEAEKAA